MTPPTYVQYGSGLCAPQGWINFDASPTLRLQRIPLFGKAAPGPKFPRNVRYGDIIKGLPVKNNSVDAVYCSHVLEHLSLADFRIALRNTFRVLKPGGIFRFVLPDLRNMAEEYVKTNTPESSAKFIGLLHMAEEKRMRGMKFIVHGLLSNSRHRWMWDYESITPELAAAGFTSIRRAYFSDSGNPIFTPLEEPTRWENCLGMQCAKPAT